ncbi:hypothetical protein J6590_033169 [Homalodisca vitripennis]|nr:hypothetical protein J6590_033169 [Homalodisca vitripennis]
MNWEARWGETPSCSITGSGQYLDSSEHSTFPSVENMAVTGCDDLYIPSNPPNIKPSLVPRIVNADERTPIIVWGAQYHGKDALNRLI